MLDGQGPVTLESWHGTWVDCAPWGRVVLLDGGRSVWPGVGDKPSVMYLGYRKVLLYDLLLVFSRFICCNNDQVLQFTNPINIEGLRPLALYWFSAGVYKACPWESLSSMCPGVDLHTCLCNTIRGETPSEDLGVLPGMLFSISDFCL